MTAPKLPKGHQSCYSHAFKYTPAAATDVRKTFRRVREAMRKAEEEKPRTVVPMKGHSSDKR